MKTYFAYIRVSTVKQGERGSSLQEQRSAIEAYAVRHGLTITAWFEEKETAAKLGRAVFSKMLADLEQRVADGLIVHKIDRSARNLKDWANLGALIDGGVDVHFAHDSVDLQSRGGRLSADIQAVVAADFVRNLREEVIKGLNGRLNQGIFPFAAPVGYLDMGKGQLKTHDPVRAPLVRQAFELYATGTMGLKDLRVELKRRGLTSVRSSRALSLTGVSTMLNNPFYLGLICIKRTGRTYQGKHEPLITKALFDRVQTILRGKLFARVYKHDFLFRRMVRCAGCGYHLIGERQKQRHIYYRCHQCPGVSVREDLLDHTVQMSLQLLTWDERELREALAVAATLQANDGADMLQVRTGLGMRLGKLDERLARLTDAYIDQAIDRDVFERRKRGILMEQRALQDSLQTLSVKDLPGAMAFEKLERGNTAYSGYRMGIPAEKREMVAAVSSNFGIQGKTPVFELLSPFREVAIWRKSQQSAHRQLTPRQSATQLLDIVMLADRTERNSVAEPKPFAKSDHLPAI